MVAAAGAAVRAAGVVFRGAGFTGTAFARDFGATGFFGIGKHAVIPARERPGQFRGV